VAGVCGWILAEGVANGWNPPPGASHGGLYLLGYGAAPLGLLGAAAMLAVLVIRRGVAIHLYDRQLVLNFPFTRKRIPLSGGLVVSATTRIVEAPAHLTNLRFKMPSTLVPQITFSRSGEADINFESPLLSEDASVIARRIADAIARAPSLD